MRFIKAIICCLSLAVLTFHFALRSAACQSFDTLGS
jgi:hypothetical protein